MGRSSDAMFASRAVSAGGSALDQPTNEAWSWSPTTGGPFSALLPGLSGPGPAEGTDHDVTRSTRIADVPAGGRRTAGTAVGAAARTAAAPGVERPHVPAASSDRYHRG